MLSPLPAWVTLLINILPYSSVIVTVVLMLPSDAIFTFNIFFAGLGKMATAPDARALLSFKTTMFE